MNLCGRLVKNMKFLRTLKSQHPLISHHPLMPPMLIYVRELPDGPYARIFYLDLIVSAYGIGDTLHGAYDRFMKISITAHDLHIQITHHGRKISFNNYMDLPRHFTRIMKDYISQSHRNTNSWTLINNQLSSESLDRLAHMLDEWIY